MAEASGNLPPGGTVRQTLAETFAAFDALPLGLRRAICAAPEPVNPVSVAQAWEVVSGQPDGEAALCQAVGALRFV